MTKEKEPKENKNMELWNQVCITDPAMTKTVNQRGGFTAICAQLQRKRATELWGPYGSTWGVKDLEWGTQGDDKPELILNGTFWYPGGEFPLGTDLPFRSGGDSRKKMLTDLTTKALSILGFNSDVFEGKYDDNKYVAEMRKKFAPVKPEPLDPEPLATDTPGNTDTQPEPPPSKPKLTFIEIMENLKKELGADAYDHIIGEEFGFALASEILDRTKQKEVYNAMSKKLAEMKKNQPR